MENAFQGRSILDVIRMLSARRESGRLQVTSGMTEGAVFLDRGQLIDARFGKLAGFQAINALASIHDATFNFDPTIAPPSRSSIAPNEQLLLQDFFGIGGGHKGQPDPDYPPFKNDEIAPAQVVPLSEVVQRKDFEMHEPHVNEDSSLPPPSLTDAATPSEPYNDQNGAGVTDDDEATVVRSKRRRAENQPALSYGPHSRSKFQPALLAVLATILVVVAAVAVIYRLRARNSTTPVTGQSSPPAATPQVSNSTAPVANRDSSLAQKPPAAISNLSGKWNVVNTVEQTSYQAYKNMEVGFELAINQKGNEFTGTGQKISENGRTLSGPSRTPISVQGSIKGDRVEATFSESGTARKTSGRFVWKIDKDKGGLSGRFASSAARTSGRSAATKTF